MALIVPCLLLIARILVKPFPVSTVEPAKRFTIHTTKDVLANNQTILGARLETSVEEGDRRSFVCIFQAIVCI